MIRERRLENLSDYDQHMRMALQINQVAVDVERLKRQANVPSSIEMSIPTDGGPFGGHIKGQFPVVKLKSDLYRTKAGGAQADVLEWTGTAWGNAGVNGTITIYGDFMRGFFFTDDEISVQYSPEAKRWYTVNNGQTSLAIRLTSELKSNQSATGTVMKNSSGTTWVTTSSTVTVWPFAAFPTGTTKLAVGRRIVVVWHEVAQKWIDPGSECPE